MRCCWNASVWLGRRSCASGLLGRTCLWTFANVWRANWVWASNLFELFCLMDSCSPQSASPMMTVADMTQHGTNNMRYNIYTCSSYLCFGMVRELCRAIACERKKKGSFGYVVSQRELVWMISQYWMSTNCGSNDCGSPMGSYRSWTCNLRCRSGLMFCQSDALGSGSHWFHFSWVSRAAAGTYRLLR